MPKFYTSLLEVVKNFFSRAQRVNIVLFDQFYSNKVVIIFYIKHAQVLHKFIGSCLGIFSQGSKG